MRSIAINKNMGILFCLVATTACFSPALNNSEPMNQAGTTQSNSPLPVAVASAPGIETPTTMAFVTSPQISIKGTCLPTAVVTAKVDGASLGSASCSSTGAYTLLVTLSARSGQRDLRVTQTLPGGPESEPASRSFRYLSTFRTIPQGVPGHSLLPTAVASQMAVANGKFYVGTNGGLAISNDQGQSFVSRTTADGLRGNDIWSVAAEGDLVVVHGAGGLAVSRDGGKTFTTKTLLEEIAYPTISIVGSDIFLSSDNGSLYRSMDFGESYTRLSFFDEFATSRVKRLNGKTYIGSSGGLFVSTDLSSFSLVHPDFEGVWIPDFELVDDTTTIVATDRGLFKTTDAGISFANVSPDLSGYVYGFTRANGKIFASIDSTFAIIDENDGSYSQPLAVGAYRISMVGSKIYATTDEGLMVSTDGGASFSAVPAGIPTGYTSMIALVGERLAVSSWNGIQISEDGGHSFPIRKTTADGLPGNGITGIAYANESLYVSTDQGAAVSTNGGNSFIALGPSGYLYDLFVSGPRILLAGIAGLWHSADGGGSFLLEHSEAPQNASGFSVSSIYQDGAKIYLAGGWNGIFKAEGEGKTFRKLRDGGIYYYDVYAAGDTVYAASANGFAVSNDGGESWSVRTTANGLPSDIIRRIYVVGSKIYLGTQSGLAISTDGGANFSGRLVGGGVFSIHQDGAKLYLGRSDGLYRSTDDGLTATRLKSVNWVNAVWASGAKIYGASYDGFIKSTDGGATWVTLGTAAGIAADAHASGGMVVRDDGATIYIGLANNYGVQEGGIAVSTNGGTSFTSRLIGGGSGSGYVYGIAAVGTGFYAGAMSGLWVADGNLSTFDRYQVPASTFPALAVTAVAELGSNIVITGSGVPGIVIGDSAFGNWRKATDNGLATNNIRRMIEANGKWYFVTDGGLSITSDQGNSSINRTTDDGLASNNVFDVFAEGQIIYVATDQGLSISLNGGETFPIKKTVADGLPSNLVYRVVARDGVIYVATDQGIGKSE